MTGNSNSGNRGAQRGKPARSQLDRAVRRITIRDDIATRLSALVAPQTNLTAAANDIIRQWLDVHYPHPPANTNS